jgi:hypothetical protein
MAFALAGNGDDDDDDSSAASGSLQSALNKTSNTNCTRRKRK